MAQLWPPLMCCRSAFTLFPSYSNVHMISIPTPQNTKNTTLVNQTWLWSTHKLCGCILRMHWVSGHISFNLYLLSLISLCAGYNGFELHPEEGTQILNDDKCITGCYGRGGKSPRILNLGPSTAAANNTIHPLDRSWVGPRTGLWTVMKKNIPCPCEWYRLPPRCTWDLRSSRMLRSVYW
jgi:hypothetical protein